MANVTLIIPQHVPGRRAAGLLYWAVSAIGTGAGGLRQDLAEVRRDLRQRQALRGLDRHLLQDIGLDRNAC